MRWWLCRKRVCACAECDGGEECAWGVQLTCVGGAVGGDGNDLTCWRLAGGSRSTVKRSMSSVHGGLCRSTAAAGSSDTSTLAPCLLRLPTPTPLCRAPAEGPCVPGCHGPAAGPARGSAAAARCQRVSGVQHPSDKGEDQHGRESGSSEERAAAAGREVMRRRQA
jgi:hypothetical protein